MARRGSRLAILVAASLVVAGLAAGPAPARMHHGARHHARRHHHHKKHHAKSHGRRTTHGTAKRTQGASAHGHFVQPSPLHANQSNNWSGYNQGSLEQGGTPPKLFTSVASQWTVPTVTQHTAGQAEYSSDWIGIGGGCVDAKCTTTDSTLIQTGTEQDVSASGAPSYSAWWEAIPGPSFTITNVAVHAGDKISSSISQLAPGVWTIKLSDLTDGQSYSSTLPYSSTEATAEFIQETPLILGANAGFAAQPNLSAPGFDLATVNGAPANLKASEAMNLVDSNNNIIGAPSVPDPDADGFNVCTWASACAAPASS
jgi:hypothetical protein